MLKNSAPFAELPSGFKQLQAQRLRRPRGDREIADILALVLHHDEQAVLIAVELALAEGVATKTHMLNTPHRLIDGKTNDGSLIDRPQALALRLQPKAAMRHDPVSGAVIIMLRSLKMHGMAQTLTERVEQGATAFGAAMPILTQLLTLTEMFASLGGRCCINPMREGILPFPSKIRPGGQSRQSRGR